MMGLSLLTPPPPHPVINFWRAALVCQIVFVCPLSARRDLRDFFQL